MHITCWKLFFFLLLHWGGSIFKKWGLIGSWGYHRWKRLMLISKNKYALWKADSIKKSHAWSPRLDVFCIWLVLVIHREVSGQHSLIIIQLGNQPLLPPCSQHSHLYPSPPLAISHPHTTAPSKAEQESQMNLATLSLLPRGIQG